jgi:nucleotide-binding universal stress UspA family protein
MDEQGEREFRVLLATDGSEPARNAEDWVPRLRWPPTCVVDVLCVASHGLARLGWPVEADRSAARQVLEKLRESEVIQAERIANEVGLRLQDRGIATRSWARQGEARALAGDIAAEILATIELDRPSLVVIGPRGRSKFAEFLLGSVSRRVIAESRSPVLVARQPPPMEPAELPRSLLVLVDGSPAVDGALDWLLAARWLPTARVTLLGLLGFAPGVEDDDPDLVAQVNEALRGDAVSTLEGLSRRLVERGCEVDLMLEQGQPQEVTLSVAEQLQPDVIVVARPSGQRAQDPLPEKVARYAHTTTLIVPER